jgi:L-alanine-DL-glutamate epimerase-like enolase superfamily enzyme
VKITSVEVFSHPLKLSRPYTIAYETITEITNLFVCIHTNSAHRGLGCAAPAAAVTGERVDDTRRVLFDIAVSLLVGEDPLLRVRLMERLKEAAQQRAPHGAPAALAAVDMALHDVLAKIAGQPLYRVLGGYRPCIQTSMTIGILSEKETVARAKALFAQGFRALKLKGGLHVEDDIVRVCKVREALGGGVELRFDANQGYDHKAAMRFLNGVQAAHIALLEQPTPRGRPRVLAQLSSTATIPVMADESLLETGDAFRIARNELADMLNIKLMKVGGLLEAQLVDCVAQAAHLETMVGCMDEAALSIAAALHFALARPNVTCADLDGHLGLIDDPTAAAVTLEDGVLYPALGPGLGLRDIC